jgi:hypothetical protein
MASPEIGGEVHKIPTASTATVLIDEKGPLNGRFLRDSLRSLSSAAGDIAVSAHDSYDEYRPHESLANDHIIDDAVDAGAILPTLAVLDHPPVLSRYPRPTTRVP